MTAVHAGVWFSVPPVQEDYPKLHFKTITSISLGFGSGLQVVFRSPVIFMHLKPPSAASEQTHKHTQNSEENSSSLSYHFYSYSTFLVYQDFDFESDNVHCSHSNDDDGHHSEVQIPPPSSPASPGRKGSDVPFILSELSLYS